jgi:Transposase DDE domain group 1
VRLLHVLAKTHALFDDPNLVSRAGLVPVMALAERARLSELVADNVGPGRRCGVNAQVKVGCLVAGMVAGADSIDDMDVLRHGALPGLFGGLRAPSTLGSFLRVFTWGNVLQLQKVHRQFLAELARRAPLLPGAGVLAFVDIDSQQKRVYGHAKQGAAFGYTKIQGKSLLVRGLNVLAATISTPLAAPVIAATRLRGGNASSARGAASMVTEAVGTARAAGCTGKVVVRMDSAFYGAPAAWAARKAGACFSVTVRIDPKVAAAIAAIPEDAWTPIRYPRAIWDDQLRCWVSDAQAAEVEYTAFTSRKGLAITARLIVRRVKDLNPKAAEGQGELFTAWRYHACSPIRRSRCSRLRSTTAAMPRLNRFSPTGPMAPLPTCHQARSPPTRPGSRSPPSATTCCAPPGPWPAWPAPKPAAPHCAAT